MLRDLSFPAFYMGVLAAFVGYAASFAIVLTGLGAVGATNDQAATGLFFATLGMGICSIWLPAVTRIPAAVAWSTPGAAFLVSSTVLPGGFGEAVGAMIACGILIIISGVVPTIGRFVAAIPKPIASALLAGVLLKLCFAPAIGIGTIPLLVLPVMLAWTVGLIWSRLAAMPFAVAAFLLVIYFYSGSSTSDQMSNGLVLPTIEIVPPIFTIQAFISVSIPLYLVTMAGQNIPGFAVLDLNGYNVDQSKMIRNTGLASSIIAIFGAIPVNMSAITAAMMAGDDAGKNPDTRYWAAIVSGFVYVALAFAAGLVTQLASIAPTTLITALAGLALIPALVGAMAAAFADKSQVEAPALTFLMTASGISLLGVSGAVWGILIGVTIWFAKTYTAK